jgi:phosphomannomutase
VTTPTATSDEYQCPGEKHPISRAMHLARLAEFFPSCRECAHHDDTGTLSAKLVKRLRAVWSNGRQPVGFTDEGFAGESPNDLPPTLARRVAAAFGLWLARSCGGAVTARVAVGNDARAIMPEYVAAVCEGLRIASCETYDVGPATSSSLEFGIASFELDGGILLGSAREKPSSVCLKFWGVGSQRFFGRSSVEPLERVLHGGFDRPARSFAAIRRLQADVPFLASLADEFHGLRPLRFVLSSASRPWVDHLEKLLQPTACQIIPCRVLPGEFASQIVADNAHFGIRVVGDGEWCHFFDEQGRAFPSDSHSEWTGVPRDAAKHDALGALIALLKVLSRDDRPCSAVLDEAADEN